MSEKTQHVESIINLVESASNSPPIEVVTPSKLEIKLLNLHEIEEKFMEIIKNNPHELYIYISNLEFGHQRSTLMEKLVGNCPDSLLEQLVKDIISSGDAQEIGLLRNLPIKVDNSLDEKQCISLLNQTIGTDVNSTIKQSIYISHANRHGLLKTLSTFSDNDEGKRIEIISINISLNADEVVKNWNNFSNLERETLGNQLAFQLGSSRKRHDKVDFVLSNLSVNGNTEYIKCFFDSWGAENPYNLKKWVNSIEDHELKKKINQFVVITK